MEKHLYLLAVLIFWATTGGLILGWYDGQSAMSYIAATNLSSYAVMMVGTTTYVVVVMKFLDEYFYKHIKADAKFKSIYAFALIFVLLVGLTPAIGGILGFVHMLSGLIVYILTLALFVMLVKNPLVLQPVKAYIILASTVGTALFIINREIAAQLVVVALAQSCILAVTYIAPKTKLLTK